MITLLTVCGPDSTTVSLPTTISSPYTYSLLYNDADLPRVELDAASVSISSCPVEAWTLTSDGVSDKHLGGIQDVVYRPGGKPIIKVLAKNVAVPTTYYFFLTYTARGGAFKTTQQIILKTICDVASTSLKASEINVHQVCAPGDNAAGFVFDKFLNDHLYCVDLKYEITTADRTV